MTGRPPPSPPTRHRSSRTLNRYSSNVIKRPNFGTRWDVNDVRTLDERRQFIHKTLCEKENLLADQFTMTEVRLTRQNEPCGLQFSLRAPRNVRLAAIWVADRNVVYLYDAAGARYAKLRLKSLVVVKEHASAA